MKLNEILELEGIVSDEDAKKVLRALFKLKDVMDKTTLEKYKRINPLLENIFDWKEKGERLFGGKNITVYETCSIAGDVKIGDNTWVGPYTALDGNGGLKIGKGCSISSHVNIVTHDSVKWALSGGKVPYEYQPIAIGDHCFIGTAAMITKGVTIGNHCLIGAGAVVTKNIPDNSIVFGVPGEVVGKVILTDNDVIYEYFKK